MVTPTTPADARQRAISLASETMSELIAFWGFKASTGRIWTWLYLSSRPLSAQSITEFTGLSTGTVSMSLAELNRWGLIERARVADSRKRHYAAQTDIWGIIRRIVRERELPLVGRAVARFTEATQILQELQNDHPEDQETAFILGRLQGLLALAQVGYQLVERFAEVGLFTLDPIRGALNRPNQGTHE